MPDQAAIDAFLNLHAEKNPPVSQVPLPGTTPVTTPLPPLPGTVPVSTPPPPLPNLPGSPGIPPAAPIPASWQDKGRIIALILQVFEEQGAVAAQKLEEWVKSELNK